MDELDPGDRLYVVQDVCDPGERGRLRAAVRCLRSRGLWPDLVKIAVGFYYTPRIGPGNWWAEDQIREGAAHGRVGALLFLLGNVADGGRRADLASRAACAAVTGRDAGDALRVVKGLAPHLSEHAMAGVFLAACASGDEHTVSWLSRRVGDPPRGAARDTGLLASGLRIAAKQDRTGAIAALLRFGEGGGGEGARLEGAASRLRWIDEEKDDGTTALWIAARYGNEASVRLLVAAGADVNCRRTEDQASAAWVSAHYGHEAVLAALLEAGANPSALSTCGTSALEDAAQRGAAAVVKQLLSAGAAECAEAASAAEEHGYKELATVIRITTSKYCVLDSFGGESAGVFATYAAIALMCLLTAHLLAFLFPE
ncbi:hypothetical protein DIPPA_29975 [Diplonema papillatum]|nr:hypothetical protein DIPPA_29975 [Diplonema papillatum]|eukprot:gene16696-25630_t